MTNREEYLKILETTVAKFGEPLKTLPIETAIRFISDYEVISSDFIDDIKILKLASKVKDETQH